MKVLLVSSIEQSDSFNHFISAFRSKIGTCEYLCLTTEKNYKSDKQLFNQYRRSMSFDRFVATYWGHASLSRLLPLFSGLEQQSFLSLQIEDEIQRKIMEKYARMNPWFRWAGSDRNSFDYYKRIGIDAYMLPPLSLGVSLYNKYNSKNICCCHVFGDKQGRYITSLPQELRYCFHSPMQRDLHSYIHDHIKAGDILLITKQEYLERQLVADAIANGAAVVIPSSELSIDEGDGFLRRACIMIDNPAELILLFEQIRDDNNQELVKQISSQAYFCSPDAVANQFVRLVGIAGRERSAYVGHRSVWL